MIISRLFFCFQIPRLKMTVEGIFLSFYRVPPKCFLIGRRESVCSFYKAWSFVHFSVVFYAAFVLCVWLDCVFRRLWFRWSSSQIGRENCLIKRIHHLEDELSVLGLFFSKQIERRHERSIRQKGSHNRRKQPSVAKNKRNAFQLWPKTQSQKP